MVHATKTGAPVELIDKALAHREYPLQPQRFRRMIWRGETGRVISILSYMSAGDWNSGGLLQASASNQTQGLSDVMKPDVFSEQVRTARSRRINKGIWVVMLLRQEFDTAMALSGCPRLTAITGDLVRPL